jgi:nicotinamidase-related amidase
MTPATDALIVIDAQNDFCLGASLAVVRADMRAAGVLLT